MGIYLKLFLRETFFSLCLLLTGLSLYKGMTKVLAKMVKKEGKREVEREEKEREKKF